MINVIISIIFIIAIISVGFCSINILEIVFPVEDNDLKLKPFVIALCISLLIVCSLIAPCVIEVIKYWEKASAVRAIISGLAVWCGIILLSISIFKFMILFVRLKDNKDAKGIEDYNRRLKLLIIKTSILVIVSFVLLSLSYFIWKSLPPGIEW